MSGALDGIRVVEMTEAMAGPWCAMLLGDFGADVIKVERPGGGDQARGWGPPFVGAESAYFLSNNRNKRSVTIDVNRPRGLEILHRLIDTADVFLTNQPRRESLERRGLDYQSLAARNPRLIYGSITGYGWSGPRSERPGYDLIAQAEAGTMSLTGEPGGEPIRFPIAIADVTTGLYAALGVMGALVARQRSGRGQFLEAALFDSQLSWLANVGSGFLNAGSQPRRWGNAHPNIVPYQMFRGGDGRYFVVAVGTEALWARFCHALEIDQTLGKDPRFATNRDRVANRAELAPALEARLAARPAAEWVARLGEADIPAGMVQTVEEAFADPQTQARKAVVETEHPGIGRARSVANPARLADTPASYRLPPPELGQHTREILGELGLSLAEMEAAEREGAV
ncbi:MAG TPA: CaiB/BaiF CoA-transferase family protein [Candidatus Acidoferrales bacterium]|nr:CaiB/BaiF CoA-transferase family protein [Candidatus Acidoferrales bacterium]